ncbi:type II toxin-antitoxin system VapC family toxin [Spirosoma fluviale]|uniref:PIN domain nuclease, a component of toxin-antitoxin system (PIN domain) n=1 Tax=Spirosoma fluviale TaxID=1597977 RepID=A0A286GVL7_9BACT|nr:type II toxin-antitoxin system VapC family toxin [Spirosoma fluviale]SOD99575.1 PIN domain nuclease, a component of toxin-antitoxin system (PIN domain) [Spirosoma fluviale]
MNLLLDTHTLIWYLEGSQELSVNCRIAIENPTNKIFVSVASFWELAIKLSIGGKIELSVSLDQLNELVRRNNISVLPVLVAHTVIVRSLPFYHKDPFDRIIIAQAMSDDMTVLSRDGHFSSYPIQVVW